MRPRVAPPPTGERLADQPLHALVRDYPEAQAALEASGLDPRRSGGQSLAELAVGPVTLDAVAARLAWRSGAYEKGATRPSGSPRT